MLVIPHKYKSWLKNIKMPEQPRNLNNNNKSTNNFPIVISLGLALLMLGLSWRIFTVITIASGVTWLVKRYQEKQKQQKII
ncbi:hypothetical protein [Okeania sp. KiyG1]|uniref:hypothetical protein n=1 Tax=Okeania sp. KiyG1 TaxID=2720165 RepID=UPI0019234F94|nr:hypothetical protein [Okeania sp. KiyG1]GGA08337.1 hypothetical protein CYANOKiyG1_20990 [Okeania sp. KiyG1]